MRTGSLVCWLAASALIAGCGFVGGGAGRDRTEGARAVNGIAENRSGDKVEFTLAVGKPQTVERWNDDALDSCDEMLAFVSSSRERALAVPIHVTMRVVSKLRADVRLTMDVRTVEIGNEPSTIWAATYDGRSVCATPLKPFLGDAVHWRAEANDPGRVREWNTWIVFPRAINPRDPAGTRVLSSLLIAPTIVLSGAIFSAIEWDPAHPSVVECPMPNAVFGNWHYIAFNPDGAIRDGCTGRRSDESSGGTAPTMACPRGFPAGIEKTVDVKGGKATRYDRTASVHRVVCGGFGVPEAQMTPGLRCVLLSAAAMFGAPFPPTIVKPMCTAVAVTEALRTGEWLRAASSELCGFLAEVFAGQIGIMVAGTTAAFPPAAVALGVTTYKVVGAGLKLACGGLLEGGAHAFGVNLEEKHQMNVAVDVLRGECLEYSQTRRFLFFSRSQWSAVPCR